VGVGVNVGDGVCVCVGVAVGVDEAVWVIDAVDVAIGRLVVFDIPQLEITDSIKKE
jgi:hypothetical protein